MKRPFLIKYDLSLEEGNRKTQDCRVVNFTRIFKERTVEVSIDKSYFMFERDNESPFGGEGTREYQKAFINGQWHEKRYAFVTKLFRNRHYKKPVIRIFYSKDGTILKTDRINRGIGNLFHEGGLLSLTRIFHPSLPESKNTFDELITCEFGGIGSLKGISTYVKSDDHHAANLERYVFTCSLSRDSQSSNHQDDSFEFNGEQLFNTTYGDWEYGKGKISFKFQNSISGKIVKGENNIQMDPLNLDNKNLI